MAAIRLIGRNVSRHKYKSISIAQAVERRKEWIRLLRQ